MTAGITETKVLSGRYQIAGQNYFSNIVRKPDGWHADLRHNDGTLRQFAGIWRTKRDACDEAIALISRHD